jgi:polyphosphate kinase
MIKEHKGYLFKDREISWMLFNERVLQEAENDAVPILERLKFLAIFSSNNDEFFRVRVAQLLRLKKIGRNKPLSDSQFSPDIVLNEIQRIAVFQQHRFNAAYEQILSVLKSKNINIISEKDLSEDQKFQVDEMFKKEVAPYMFPVLIDSLKTPLYLKDRVIYLAIRLTNTKSVNDTRHAIIELSLPPLKRFYRLPDSDGKSYIMFLDDMIRHSLHKIFSIFRFDKFEAYTIKITRDAEFTIENEENHNVRETFLERIQRSLKQRNKGLPTRLVYDNDMPKDMMRLVMEKLHLRNLNLIPGGRYHNFKDFMDFPEVGSKPDRYKPLPPIPVPELETAKAVFDVIDQKDIILHHPYQSFDYLIRMLREAAIDPDVKSIKITLYRVAKHSNVVNALINALKNGKKVTVLMELQARFDEESNIYWTRQLQDAGARVHFGKPGQKVHCKICVIHKEKDGKNIRYAHLSTGNYNGVTARLYGDHGLFTKNQALISDVEKLFDILFQTPRKQKFEHLIVAPDSMLKEFIKLIDTEITNAKSGKPAYIIAKMNSFTEDTIVRKLYDASRAGVKIDLIVRGTCAIVPGVKGLSETIRVISIIDRLLEHARIFIFANGGQEKIYLSSADWMQRNIFRRIECAFPIYDEHIKKEIKDIIAIQLRDNCKARIIDADFDNKYVGGNEVDMAHRAQYEIYAYLSSKCKVEEKS